MRHISLVIALALALAFACGGGGSSTPAPTPTPTPTPSPVAIPNGTYRATVKTMGLAVGASTSTPIGNITQTMIVMNDGNARLELAGWQQLRAAIYADAQGNLQLGLDPTLTYSDGTSVPLTLTGTLAGGHMVGTTNGGTFDVTLTTIQDTVIDPATKAGTWISTASSNGQVMRLHIPADFSTSYNMTVEAYATSADATAKTNQLGTYTGSFGWSDGDTTHTRNCFNIGFAWAPTGSSNLMGGVGGLAYFAPDGTLVVLASMPHDNGQTWNKQLSAIFVKE